jgi:dTDP-4-dehydrorhamnose 3,5-epimerase
LPVTIVDGSGADTRAIWPCTYCEREFDNGLPTCMQTNMSLTSPGGRRSMHVPTALNAEDKLVRCVQGAIWDAIVDIRPESPTASGLAWSRAVNVACCWCPRLCPRFGHADHDAAVTTRCRPSTAAVRTRARHDDLPARSVPVLDMSDKVNVAGPPL